MMSNNEDEQEDSFLNLPSNRESDKIRNLFKKIGAWIIAFLIGLYMSGLLTGFSSFQLKLSDLITITFTIVLAYFTLVQTQINERRLLDEQRTQLPILWIPNDQYGDSIQVINSGNSPAWDVTIKIYDSRDYGLIHREEVRMIREDMVKHVFIPSELLLELPKHLQVQVNYWPEVKGGQKLSTRERVFFHLSIPEE